MIKMITAYSMHANTVNEIWSMFNAKFNTNEIIDPITCTNYSLGNSLNALLILTKSTDLWLFYLIKKKKNKM